MTTHSITYLFPLLLRHFWFDCQYEVRVCVPKLSGVFIDVLVSFLPHIVIYMPGIDNKLRLVWLQFEHLKQAAKTNLCTLQEYLGMWSVFLVSSFV